MPIVDIIVPAYNAARFLPSALDSVGAQTFSDWRILLVNDGSTDNTDEIVAHYQEQFGEKLKYIKQANAGLPAARNAAIRNSSSEFLALLDADDIWLPLRLEESLKSFSHRPQAGLSYGMVDLMDQDGNILQWKDRRQKNAEGWIATAIYTRRLNLPCPTITFRRQCIEDVGLFDETMRATEDRDMWLRIALKYEVRFVEKVIACYRRSPASISSDLNRMRVAQLQFVEKHYRKPGCGAWPRQVAHSVIHRQQAEELIQRNQPWHSIKHAFHALVLNPLDGSNLQALGSVLRKWPKASAQR